MNKILVPVDFSTDSINAIEMAIVIANKSNASIRLIHVSSDKKYDIPIYFKDLMNGSEFSAESAFDILINKYKNQIKVPFETTIRYGKVYREISNQAKYDDTDLIIMGTHGISGFEALFIGSNAYKVVSNVDCNVLTVRNGFMKRDIKRIVVPIDSSKQTRQKIEDVSEFATIFNAMVYVVAVRETRLKKIIERINKYSDQVCKYFESKNIKYERAELYGRNITDMTIDFAVKHDADMISIMTEQTQNTSNLWLGKYAQQMVNNSPVPVMSVHPK